VCNPTAVKDVEELHTRSKGYSTLVSLLGPCSLLMVASARTHTLSLRTHAQMTRAAAAAAMHKDTGLNFGGMSPSFHYFLNIRSSHGRNIVHRARFRRDIAAHIVRMYEVSTYTFV